MSGGQFAVTLTPLGERPTFDPSTAVEDRLAPTEVHIGGREKGIHGADYLGRLKT